MREAKLWTRIVEKFFPNGLFSKRRKRPIWLLVTYGPTTQYEIP